MLTNIGTMYTREELANLLNTNYAFSDYCFNHYGYYQINFDIDDFLYNAPFSVNGGCVYAYSVYFNTDTIANIEKIPDWIKDSTLVYSCEFDITAAARRWADLIERRDFELYGDDLSTENWDRLNNRIEELEGQLKSAIVTELDCINEQFDDLYYFADFLLSMEYLTDCLINERGEIFTPQEPLKRIA